jgi:hypothetical protein
MYTTEACAAQGVSTPQSFLLHMDVFSQLGPLLSLDMSGQQ